MGLRQDLLRKQREHLKSQKQELVAVVSQMVEFDDPSLGRGTDFDLEVYDIHRSSLFHAHLVRLELCHNLE
jgi:transcriptional antiterminator